MRIDFGPLAFLMFIFVVKLCDIGAYTFGRLFGKHKFSPVISPKKTWEGMAGGVLFSVIAASLFGKVFGIMPVLPAIIFGIVFAFIGQLGDLAESMLKRICSAYTAHMQRICSAYTAHMQRICSAYTAYTLMPLRSSSTSHRT